jgi:hypothetical protein
MTAVEIMQAAKRDGLIITLSPGGSIKATGEQSAVNRWLPLLKEHKAEIITMLSTRPEIPDWCKAGCQGLEAIELPLEGPTWGCVQQCYDFKQWTRLDGLACCPNRAMMVH